MDCLNSIFQNGPREEFEIIVVDNASTDNSQEMVEKKFPQAKLIKNKTNVGFAKANNQAIKKAQGKYILLLNPDTGVKPNALQAMINFLNQYSEVGAVGPKLVFPNGEVQIEAGRHFPTIGGEFFTISRLCWIFPKNQLVGRYLMTYWAHDDTREVDLLSGACIMIRNEVIKKIGLLDESYFMYGEDVDLCYRIRQAGWKNYFVSNAEVVHYIGQCTKQVKQVMRLSGIKSMYRFFATSYNRFYALIYTIVLPPALTLNLLARLLGIRRKGVAV